MTTFPHGWTEAEAWEAYETYSTGAEAGRSFEAFINFQWEMDAQCP